MINKKTGSMFGIVFCTMILLLGCSEENQEAQETTSDGSAETQDEKRGGTLNMAIAADPPTLDPHSSSSIYTNNYAGLMYNKLVTYETGPDTDYTEYNVVPDLADDWEVSEDGTVYTFYLRDAQWHDISPVNGREVVADDVVATMERIETLPGHQSSLLNAVEDVEAEDEKTVVFTLEEPFAPFLNFMANHFMWILPQEALDGDINLDNEAIGTGPFMLEEWNENVQATFVRNPDFYEEGKPYLDEVIQRVIPDRSAALSAFRTGEVETIGQVSPEEADNLISTNPEVTVDSNTMATQSQVYMNMDREPFDDLRVRQAISMAIDRDNIIETLFTAEEAGGGEVSGPVNPSLEEWALPLEEREALQPYDPDEAQSLLEEAGYADGFDTTVMVTDGYGEELVRLSQWIVEDLRDIGINAELEMVEYGTYYSDRWPNQDYDIGVGYQTYLQEADEWLTSQYGTDEAMNWFGISDPELDEMLEEQQLIHDEDERMEKVDDIQRYALENVVNPIPLITQQVMSPRQPYVNDWHPHASYGYLHMKDVWIEE